PGFCSCPNPADTICKQITITDTGSNCQADYCYTATDTSGTLEVTFYNISTSDDSITNVYWDFNDGTQSIQYTDVQHIFPTPGPNHITYLYIQTASGCQSVYVDTIQVGTNCDSVPTGTTNSQYESKDLTIKIHPTIIHSTATVKTNLTERQIEIRIYDLTGRQVRLIELNNNRTFDRNQLKQGIYIYKVTVDNKIIQTGKLIYD
ncbi:MAG: T9SS type A sorting domain-containing protein, partial [Cytophagales bacterium]|nr:T9SS type A sorting domain-containing protein [Cytophagales bacterium]